MSVLSLLQGLFPYTCKNSILFSIPVGGEPTNCTGDSECGSGYFCMLDCPVDNYPPHVAFLSSPLTLRGQSSMFVPSSRYPAYSGGDFTVVARFRQDPNDDGYLLYYSVDAQTHTFGIFLNASMNVLKILYTPVGETVHRFKTIDLSIPINDNAYHTLAVTVNSKITGYHVETITDGSYSGGFDNDISIDTSPRVRQSFCSLNSCYCFTIVLRICT